MFALWKKCRPLPFACAVLFLVCAVLTVIAAWYGKMTRFESLLHDIDEITQWMYIRPMRLGVTLFALAVAASAAGMLPLCFGKSSRVGQTAIGVGLRATMLAMFLTLIYFILHLAVMIITSLSVMRTFEMTILIGTLILSMIGAMIWWGLYTIRLRKLAEGADAALRSGRPVYAAVTFPVVTASVIAALLLLTLLTDGRPLGHAAALTGAAAHALLAVTLYRDRKESRAALQRDGSLPQQRMYLHDYMKQK